MTPGKYTILSLYDHEYLFSLIKEFSDKESKKYINPLREDNTPGCYFQQFGGTLYFIDWAYTPNHLDAYEFISRYIGSNEYKDILEFIINNKREYEPSKILKTVSVDTRNYDFVFRNWQVQDKDYWQAYYISSDNLNDDGVKPVEELVVNNKRVRISQGYYIADTQEPSWFTIYQPNNPDFKFYKNTSVEAIGNFKSLYSTSDTLIISKSYKDSRVLRNLFPDLAVIYFNSETSFPKNLSFLDYYKNRFIIYDNDEPGIKGAKELNKVVKGKIIVPPKVKNFTDIADLIKYDRDKLIKWIMSTELGNISQR